ncbi:MAG: hypothetical protein JRJ27_12995 [Deltaproteobacteria bacterium]|nr:hypothetical protein [Deltaproteobacteria bacterium]
MKKALLVIMVVLVCGAFLTSCGAPKYVHKDPAFSFEYPHGYKPGKVQGTAVARFENQNQYRIPNYSLGADDKAQGATLDNFAEGYSEVLQGLYPKASRFKILEKNMVKLSDGSDAVAWKLKWRWIDRVTYLQSSGVAAFKGNKSISCFGTTIFGGDTSMDMMLDQCKTLKLTP